MARENQVHDDGGGLVRRKLGALTHAGIRVLSGVARRLRTPALATVPVSAVMLTRLDTVSPDQHLEDVAQLFIGGRNAQLPVLEDGYPIGVVTRSDVAIGLERMGPHGAVGDAPHHEVVAVTPSDSLVDVLAQLRASPHSVAVVVDHGTPVGVVTVEHLIAYAAYTKLLV